MTSQPTARHERSHFALSLAGLSAIALLFVPFAYDYVPIKNAFLPESFLDPTWSELWPCLLLPWLVSAGHWVRLARGSLPRAIQLALLWTAAIAILPFIAFLVAIESPFDWTTVAAVLCFGGPLFVFAAFVGIGMSGQRDSRGLVALQGVYITQLGFWLLFATGNFEIGAWLGVAAYTSYLIQACLFARRAIWVGALIAGSLAPSLVFYWLQM
jgi:hypothetical protein